MLWRKMLRDLKDNKGAYAAAIIIIVIGLAAFTSFSLVIENLRLSQNSFYQNYHFADGFARVKGIPMAQVKKLQDIKGIDRIQGRLVKDVRVLFPQREENVYLRLVSVDPEEQRPVNGVELSRGIGLDPDRLNIWIDNKFFAANELELNSEIPVIAEGKKRTLQVVGVGRSPEFVYALRTSGELYPNPETFGIAFIPYQMMTTLFPQNNAVNDIVFTLKPGTDYQDVEDSLKPKLKPYGLTTIYPRKNQTSHMLLSEELKGLEAAAQGVPVLFLSIAGMILYIMLKRMIEQQRGQIGILKAFGYTHREIIFHYLSYALTIGTIGGILGGVLGLAGSYPFTSLYEMFFNMPGLQGRFSLSYLIWGLVLSLGFSLCAGYLGARRVLSLHPAEAMRPPVPPVGKKVWLEGVVFFWHMLTVQGKMAVRNISRNKGRSVFVFLGIMLTFAIIGLTWSMNDLVQIMLFDQYEKVQTYDVKLTLANPVADEQGSRELSGFAGVKRVEAMAEVPATLKNKWHKKEAAILGLPKDSSLYHIIDKKGQKIQPPANGLLISERLAELLDARVGTKLTVESLMLKEPDETKELEVVGIIPQYLGINAYMEIHGLQEFLGQDGLATSFMLSVDEAGRNALKQEYRTSAVVSGVEDQKEMLAQSQEMMASFGSMIYIYALVGIIIGFAIIYNSSLITLSERSHELASMQVLGMTPGEVLSVITFEQWFTGFLGMIAGIPTAKLLLVAMSQSISNDVYTMPADMTVFSLVMAFLITTASIWVAQKAAGRKIKSLSLVEALKSSE